MNTPYRTTPPRPRYSITVDGELFEGEHFREIIRAMRKRGHTHGDIVTTALLVSTVTVLDDPRWGMAALALVVTITCVRVLR